jgi:excisionase family DNA binding protein
MARVVPEVVQHANMNFEPALLNLDQVADCLNVSPRTVQNLDRDGKLRSRKVHGFRAVRWRTDEVRKYARSIPINREAE